MKKIIWSSELVENLKSFIQKGLMDKEIATKMNTTLNAIRLKRRRLLLFKRKTSFTTLSIKKQRKIISTQDKKHNKKYRAKNLDKIQKHNREHKKKIRTSITIDFNNGNRTAYWEFRTQHIKNTSAKSRKINFNLTPLDLENQWIIQNGKCFYTNVYLKANMPSEIFDSDTSLSIDRIDSKVGYEKNNIRLVSYTVNTMKRDHSHQKFIKLCQQIAQNNYKL